MLRMVLEAEGALTGERPVLPESGEAGFVRRVLYQLRGPSTVAAPLAIVALVVLRNRGVIAAIPYWLIVVLVFGALISGVVVAALVPDRSRGWRLALRVGVMMAAVAAVVYSTGWAPILFVGFIFGAAEMIRVSGSAAAVPAMIWSVVFVGVGQVLMALGIVPTRISAGTTQGLAALALLGVLLTVVLMRSFALARESVESELRHREGRFRALVHNATDIILVIDDNAVVRYASPAFQRHLGLTEEWWRARSISELVHPEDLARLMTVVPETVDEPGAVMSTEFRLCDSGGEWHWFEASIANHFDDPDIEGIIANLHDITERKRSERELWEAHEHFSSSFEEAPIGMALIDLEGRIVRANSAYARIVGRDLSDIVGLETADVIHPDDQEESVTSVADLLRGDDANFRSELHYVRPDGTDVWVTATAKCVRDSDDRPVHVLGQFVDVTAERAMRQRMNYAAIHDSLTGLPNRALFMDRLSMALSRAQRSERHVGMVFIDLDRFKLVNDSMGHMAGDKLLVAVAELLRRSIRPGDTVARMGGDEFTVLCEDIGDYEEASGIAGRLMEAFKGPIFLEGGPVFVAASMGVAISGSNDSPSSLMRQADTAMYLAKDSGRGRVEIFNEKSHAEAVNMLRTTNELHRALERSEFCVYYQPIVQLATERLIGLEALVRWRHPTRGVIGPGQFLDLAEESGLIVSIGRWVLQEACRQVAVWEARRGGPHRRPIGLSVNVSARQLLDPNFMDEVKSAVESSGLAPGALCLEITEHTLVRDMESTVGALEVIRDYGVRLSLDDFGTGFSSLSYLKRFKIDSLKVDRSFVDGLGIDPEDIAIVDAVITLAHSLGISAVAEGVETVVELDELRRLGCDMVQGYLLGTPLPAEDLGPVLGEALGAWRLAAERHLA
jgi:diguanylate cyclase (GGDEF)-like protein/PAS domain S-box-containing protein